MPVSTIVSEPVIYRQAYRAAVEGKLGTLQEFYSRHPTAPVNASGDTVLHVLALNCHAEAFHELMELSLPDYGLMTKNYKGHTALHEAARVGCVEIAREMVCKEQSLVSACNPLGETPLYWAALFGQKKMLHFLRTINGSANYLRRYDGCTILHAAVMGEFYGLSLEIMALYPDLVFARNERGTTALHILAQSPLSFRSGTGYTHINLGYFPMVSLQMIAIVIYLCIPVIDYEQESEHLNQYRGSFHRITCLQGAIQDNYSIFVFLLAGMIRRLLRRFLWVREIYDAKQKHKCAEKLAKHLIGKMTNWSYNMNAGRNPSQTWISSSSTNFSSENRDEDPLLLATKLGIVEMVKNILDEFPEAIDLVDENGKNILHLALEHRKVGVFELLKSKKFPIARMTAGIDKDGNTPLHLAAKLSEHRPRHVRGAPRLMSWEVLWFKSAQRISPPHLVPLLNYYGETAEELFDHTHKSMLREAEMLTKDTARTSIVISTLLATLSFTAAITVPGGYSAGTGIPVLFKKKDFSKFMLCASLSLFLCLVTLGMSVSVQLSRFRKEDFYISLPLRYFITANSHFYSVVYQVAAYSLAYILDTNSDIPPLHYGIGLAITFGSCIFMIFLYIDIMYTVVRYFVDVFILLYHCNTFFP